MTRRDWGAHLDPFEKAALRAFDAQIEQLDAQIAELRRERRRVAKDRELYVNRGSARARLSSRCKRESQSCQTMETIRNGT